MKFKGWDKVEVITDRGEKVSAVAPLIISASRATDIPAFYAAWFMKRLEKGYSRWINPFSGVSQYVSFSKTRFIVFTTKNPGPIVPFLPELDKRKIGYYFQVTLNDYENEGFEPGVPPLDQRIAMFSELSQKIGKERVLWRFDPLVVTATLGTAKLMEKIERIGGRIHPFTERCTVSFLVHYEKVKRNMKAHGIREFTEQEIVSIARDLNRLAKKWGIKVVTCAESRSLPEFGIEHGKCIDGDLIVRLSPHDRELLDFFGVENGLFGPLTKNNMKDPGQRVSCICTVSKDIGRYDTCPHLCTYCYANSSPARVQKRCKSIDISGDSL